MQFPKTDLQTECHSKHVSLTVKQIWLHDNGIFSAWFKQNNTSKSGNCFRTRMGFLPPNCGK